MLDPSTRTRRARRRAATIAGAICAAVLLGTALPRAADAMCCSCRNCADTAFCVDHLGNALACANFCVAAGCSSTVFDAGDVCAGGCGVAPQDPTATASATASATATATRSATATATVTGTAADTATATPTATATASGTPTATAALSGQIRYYSNDDPVQNVDVSLIGNAPATVMTDAAGAYAFSAVGTGMQSVQPAKQGDFNVAVTALDATLVLRYVAALEPLSSDQLLAGDVTGNGTVSALDATRILQFQAGIITEFPAATACASDWLFRPNPVAVPGQTVTPPQLNAGVCQPGAIGYDDQFTPPASGQNFVAILLGDTTGNWAPTPVPTPTP